MKKQKDLPAPITGEVRGIQQRSEQGSPYDQAGAWTIWTFKVERYDSAGNRLPPVPVEMRGRSFEGFVSEADQIELPAEALREWQPGQTVRPRQVRNLTNGAIFRASAQAGRGEGSCAFLIAISIFSLFFLAAALFMGWAFGGGHWLGLVIGGLFGIIPAVFAASAGASRLRKR